MPIPTGTKQPIDVYETLGQLIKDPTSFGLREHLPSRVVAALISTREILRKEIDGGSLVAGEGSGENDLASELSQDADTQHGIPDEEQKKMSFNQLLYRRMQQLQLSNYEVAVSLGCTMQHVRDLIKGVRPPTDLDIAELALLLGVTQENIARCAQRKIESLAAIV